MKYNLNDNGKYKLSTTDKNGDNKRVDAVFVGAELEENLSIRMLASSVRKAGLDCILIPFNKENEISLIAEKIIKVAPSLVGLSMAFQHRAAEFLNLAELLRNMGYKGHISCGGHFATSTAGDILINHDAIDTVIRHDGEKQIVMLIQSLEDRKRWTEIPSLTFRDQNGNININPSETAIRNLDELPWAARDGGLLIHAGKKFTSLVGSRGCYGNCKFCAINSYHRSRPGPRFRFRSPENIAQEMAFLYHEMGARIFCFHDETWFLPNPSMTIKRLGKLAERLKDLNTGKIAIVAKCRPDAVTTNLLSFLAENLGLSRLYIGVENFSPNGLNNLGRGMTRETIEKSFEILKNTNIYFCYNLLLFEPDTRMEDILINLDAIEKHSEVPVNMARTEIYNGTALWYKLKKEGRLKWNYLATDYEIADPSANAMFKIFAQTFKDRFFALDSISNMNSSLGYEVKILEHFSEKTQSEQERIKELHSEWRKLTVKINLNTLKYLREIYNFCRDEKWKNEKNMINFIIDLAGKVNFDGAKLYSELLLLRRQIKPLYEKTD